MSELKYKPVQHRHAAFIERARARRGFTAAYTELELESAGKHTPSPTTLKKYAHAVGCELRVKLVPHKVP